MIWGMDPNGSKKARDNYQRLLSESPAFAPLRERIMARVVADSGFSWRRLVVAARNEALIWGIMLCYLVCGAPLVAVVAATQWLLEAHGFGQAALEAATVAVFLPLGFAYLHYFFRVMGRLMHMTTWLAATGVTGYVRTSELLDLVQEGLGVLRSDVRWLGRLLRVVR